jgi:peptidoglycan/LPS O-acetylase OafA/YrhL
VRRPPPATAPLAGARLPGLDALRAWAIIWVMLYHASGTGLIPDGNVLADHGWMGVDLFFVLSGYLIGGQLFREMARGAPLDLRSFYLRRAFRTLPAYTVVLAVYFLAPHWREFKDIQPLWQFVTFTENLLIVPRPPKAFSHVWSLCVEEQFYLVFPFIVLALVRRPSVRKTAIICAAVLLGGMLLRGAIWWHSLAPYTNGDDIKPGYIPTFQRLLYYPTWTRLDGLFAGVLAASLEVFRPGWWQAITARANLLLVAGLAGLGASFGVFKHIFPGLWQTVVGYPLISLSLGLIVVAATSPNCAVFRRPIPGAKTVALMSYSLYLSHKLLIGWGASAFATPDDHVRWWPGLIVALAIAVVGSALHFGVERPALKLRDRLVRTSIPGGIGSGSGAAKGYLA